MTDRDMPAGTEIRNPRWLKPSMTVEAAARQCRMRHCTLKARWDKTMGLTLVAVKS